MNKRGLSVTTIVTVLLGGCAGGGTESVFDDFQIDNPYDGLWQDSPEVPFSFVLEQTFGAEEEPEEELLSSLGPVVADNDGNVYMLQSGANRLVSFDASGAFRWRTGRHGEGPGEFHLARSLVWNGEGYLFISNQSGKRIDVYDLMGHYVDSHSVAGFNWRSTQVVGILGPEQLVIKVPNVEAFGVTVVVMSLEQNPKIESQINLDQSDGLQYPPMMMANSFVGVVNGEIVVSHPSKYRFEFYDRAGNRTRIVTRKMDDLVRPGRVNADRRIAIRYFSNLRTPVQLDGGYFLVYASWPTNVDDPDEFALLDYMSPSARLQTIRTFDLFSDTWQLLYSWTSETDARHGPGIPRGSDSNGSIYVSTSRDFPQFGKYRVEVDLLD